MNIPEEAVQAAAETFAYATGNDWRQVSAPDQEIYLQEARAALQAALPHIEAALRKQIANDPGYYAITQSELPSPDEMRAKGWHIAPKWGDLCPKCVEKGNQK